MRITVIMATKEEGCNYYRMWLPHKDMGVTFVTGREIPEDYECDLLIWHHKHFNLDIMRRMKAKGIKQVVDFDDWIEVPTDHILSEDYNSHKAENIEQARLADWITTTTDILRNKLLPFNQNIEIIPNALNEKVIFTASKRMIPPEMNFGYTGGMCHLPDVRQLTGLMERLQKDPFTNNRFYFSLAGWHPASGTKKEYMRILSGGGKYLRRIIPIPLMMTTDFLKIYNLLDVSLIPLTENEFNCSKSEIKLIESAYNEKAVICQDIDPYKKLLTPGNSLKVENRHEWYKHCKYLIQNRNKVNEMASQLKADICPKFNLDYWNNYRKEFYKHIAN